MCELGAALNDATDGAQGDCRGSDGRQSGARGRGAGGLPGTPCSLAIELQSELQVLNPLGEDLRFCRRARLAIRQGMVSGYLDQARLPLRPIASNREPSSDGQPPALLTEPRRLCQQRVSKPQQPLSARLEAVRLEPDPFHQAPGIQVGRQTP